ASDIDISRTVHGDALGLIMSRSSQVGRPDKRPAGIEFRHKSVTATTVKGYVISPRSHGETRRRSLARHIGVSRRIHGDGRGYIVPASSQVGGKGKAARARPILQDVDRWPPVPAAGS